MDHRRSLFVRSGSSGGYLRSGIFGSQVRLIRFIPICSERTAAAEPNAGGS